MKYVYLGLSLFCGMSAVLPSELDLVTLTVLNSLCIIGCAWSACLAGAAE